MALNLGSALTQKFGPFPGWAWLLAIGGGVFLLAPKLFGGSGTGTTTAPPAGTFDPASYQAGFAQGATYFQQQGNAAAAPTPNTGPAGYTGPDVLEPMGKPMFNKEPPDWRKVLPPVRVAAGQFRTQPVKFGVGGPGRSGSIGSMSTDPHAYFHPSMKQPPLYPHFVRGGVGGAAGPHQAMVHNVAHLAGIHPARLLALNGRRPQKYIRVA